MSVFLKGGTIWVDGQWRKGDVCFENGRITAVGDIAMVERDEVVNVAGLHVLPGFVDMHCHLREPGFEYKETIATGTRSAALGGFTAVACMANTMPVADNAAVISAILAKAEDDGVVRVYPIGAMSKGLKGQEMAEIGDMCEAGAVAVSDDGKPMSNSQLMRMVMQYASDFGLLVIDHCEDLALVNDGVMNEGYMSTVLGLRGNTRAAEETMIARDIVLSETLQLPVHIAHVSTRGGVQLICEAKKRGVRVSAETAPHYFALTDEAVEGYDALMKVNPPLRTADDVLAVKMGLRDGTIDAIATDHAPHHADEKAVEFDVAASGFVGFETAFALGYTHLVKNGIMSLEDLVQKMSENPAYLLGVDGGRLECGKNADLVIVDLEKEWDVNRMELASKSKNSPFDGMHLTGKVKHTIVGGKWVVRDGKLTDI